MGLSRRQFTKEFKLAAVRRLEQGVSIAEAARALEVNPNVLHRWRREFRQGPGNVFPGHGKQRWSESRIAELERKVGQQTLEIDFLKALPQNDAVDRIGQIPADLGHPQPVRPAPDSGHRDWLRSGAGSRPWRSTMAAIVRPAISCPRLARAPESGDNPTCGSLPPFVPPGFRLHALWSVARVGASLNHRTSVRSVSDARQAASPA